VLGESGGDGEEGGIIEYEGPEAGAKDLWWVGGG